MKKYFFALLGLFSLVTLYGSEQLTVLKNLTLLVNFINNTPLENQVDIKINGEKQLNPQIKNAWNKNINQALLYIEKNNRNVFGQEDATISNVVATIRRRSGQIIALYDNIIESRNFIQRNESIKAIFAAHIRNFKNDLIKENEKLSAQHRTTSKQHAQFVLKEVISTLFNILNAIETKAQL